MREGVEMRVSVSGGGGWCGGSRTTLLKLCSLMGTSHSSTLNTHARIVRSLTTPRCQQRRRVRHVQSGAQQPKPQQRSHFKGEVTSGLDFRVFQLQNLVLQLES